jgi:hypothetical protein
MQPAAHPLPFEELDFLYMPSRDVAADVAHFTNVVGARLVFAIDDGSTRVAMLELTDSPPRVLLTDHVEGDAPILIYRVPDLEATVRTLRERGWSPSRTLEIPQGPVASFRAPGGQRIAFYERTRPEVEAHFTGRRDF